MGKVTGFLEIDRQERAYKPASDRIRQFKEFTIPLEDRDVERQAARCMDCGTPYCHVGMLLPEKMISEPGGKLDSWRRTGRNPSGRRGRLKPLLAGTNPRRFWHQETLPAFRRPSPTRRAPYRSIEGQDGDEPTWCASGCEPTSVQPTQRLGRYLRSCHEDGP